MNPLKPDAKACSNCPRQHRLTRAGHIFKQDMSLAKQRDQNVLNGLALSNDDLFNIFDQRGSKFLNIIHGVVSLGIEILSIIIVHLENGHPISVPVIDRNIEIELLPCYDTVKAFQISSISRI